MNIELNYPKKELIYLYQKIFYSLPIGIALYDQSGQCYFANKKTAELVGADDVEQVIKQNFHYIETWKKSGLYDIAQEAIQKLKTMRFVNNFHTTFGKNVWLDILLNPFLVEENVHLMLVILDITDLKVREIEYKNLSIIDPLTGIYNRRYLEEKMQEEIYRSSRSNKPLSFILIDIDYFKQYNDIYGHIAGDTCLISISQSIKNTLKRKTDFFARYGGEEFICVLPYTDLNGAIKIANNLKDKVENLGIPHEKSLCSKYVTISQGIYTIDSNSIKDIKICIDNVDKAMYMAKKNGRNRIEIFKEESIL